MIEYALQLFGHLQIMNYWYGISSNDSEDYLDY